MHFLTVLSLQDSSIIIMSKTESVSSDSSSNLSGVDLCNEEPSEIQQEAAKEVTQFEDQGEEEVVVSASMTFSLKPPPVQATVRFYLC